MIQLISIIVTLAMLLGLNLFLHRTMAGRAMRAAAEDFAVLRLMGLRANSVVATAFAISGLLAGVAGVLWVAQRGSVDPLMGALPVLKAFIAAIIGGLGSLSGAVAGGFLLGFIEVILQAYLPESLLPYRDAFAILLVIAVLLFRPQGLLARKTLVKL
jgi:branched-chain amino acid transport system permease protein